MSFLSSSVSNTSLYLKKILYASVKCDFEEISNKNYFSNMFFNLIAEKITNTIAHQRTISKVKKKQKRLSQIYSRNIHFIKKNRILSRDTVPLNVISGKSKDDLPAADFLVDGVYKDRVGSTVLQRRPHRRRLPEFHLRILQ
jgi:hypothetical protein